VENLKLTKPPVAKTGMLIRRPVADVFEAFVDPGITTKFWFTKGSGRLEAGGQVTWEWEMYGATAVVDVKEIEVNKRIVIEWRGAHGPAIVEWVFTSLSKGQTFVDITNTGFGGTADEQVEEAAGSGQGFCWTLAGAKAWLEHGIQLNLVLDRFPKGLSSP